MWSTLVIDSILYCTNPNSLCYLLNNSNVWNLNDLLIPYVRQHAYQNEATPLLVVPLFLYGIGTWPGPNFKFGIR